MEIPLKEDLRKTSLVKVLVYLNRNRKTGTLSVRTPVFTKKIYLNMGDAIFASSTYPDDRLGEMLLKADKITVEQYDKSVELLKSSKKRQGAILVELGYITPKDLFWGVKYQVKEIIHSMFQIEEGEYEFIEGDILEHEVITLKMSMGNLIYEGIKRIENWTSIRSELPDTGSVIKLSDDPLSLFQEIELSSQDKKILSLIDGKRTIGDVIENSWMGSFEALKILYVLWSIGIVELKAADTGEKKEKGVLLTEILRPASDEDESILRRVDSVYAQLGSIDMHQLLEIDEYADSDTVKKNYFRLAKEFHPDRYFAIADPSVKVKLTAIFDAITNAYNSLKDEKQRRNYFKTMESSKKVREGGNARQKAEESFRKGLEDFKKGLYPSAVQHLKSTIKLLPKNPGYWNYLSLAYSKIPGKLNEAEEALMNAIKLDPANADYLSNLGLIYLKAGSKKKARQSFEKALKIDPGNEKAKKGIEKTK